MKRIPIILIAAALLLFSLGGCSQGLPRYNSLSAHGGTVTIDAAKVGQQAVFYNYDADGVTVQLIALRGADGTLHTAFNTCQNCSPSPKAYYQQEGDKLICQNCGFDFSPEEVGAVAGGCNPWPIQSLQLDGDVLTVAQEELAAMKAPFARWGGPVR